MKDKIYTELVKFFSSTGKGWFNPDLDDEACIDGWYNLHELAERLAEAVKTDEITTSDQR
jgi:hypothetical protein